MPYGFPFQGKKRVRDFESDDCVHEIPRQSCTECRGKEAGPEIHLIVPEGAREAQQEIQ